MVRPPPDNSTGGLRSSSFRSPEIIREYEAKHQGLVEVDIRTLRQAVPHEAERRVRREHQDGRALFHELAKLGQDVKAIHFRHQRVKQDQVERLASHGVESFACAARHPKRKQHALLEPIAATRTGNRKEHTERSHMHTQ